MTRGQPATAHLISTGAAHVGAGVATALAAILSAGRSVDLGLTGRVALVVGASKGLGKAAHSPSPARARMSPSVPDPRISWLQRRPASAT